MDRVGLGILIASCNCDIWQLLVFFIVEYFNLSESFYALIPAVDRTNAARQYIIANNRASDHVSCPTLGLLTMIQESSKQGLAIRPL